jgi:hypothetical protein
MADSTKVILSALDHCENRSRPWAPGDDRRAGEALQPRPVCSSLASATSPAGSGLALKGMTVGRRMVEDLEMGEELRAASPSRVSSNMLVTIGRLRQAGEDA